MRRWAIVVGIFLFVCMGGCAGKSHPTVTLPVSLHSKILLVLPFRTCPSKRGIVTCPVCGRNNPAGPIAPEAAGALTDMLVAGLEEMGYRVVPVSEVAGELSRMQKKKAEDVAESVSYLSRKFGVKLVVLGVVFEYRSRQGASLGVEQPAAVSFGLHLMRGSDGRILWSDRYYEEQKALSEDISNIGKFFKRGGKWVTARRLAEDGMKRLLSYFPEAK